MEYLELQGTELGAQIVRELKMGKPSSLKVVRVIDDVFPVVIVAIVNGKKKSYDPGQLSGESLGRVLKIMGFPDI